MELGQILRYMNADFVLQWVGYYEGSESIT